MNEWMNHHLVKVLCFFLNLNLQIIKGVMTKKQRGSLQIVTLLACIALSFSLMSLARGDRLGNCKKKNIAHNVVTENRLKHFGSSGFINSFYKCPMA